MKTKIIYQLTLVAACTGIFFACKKSNSTGAGTSAADLQTQSDDQDRVSTETDASYNDVNTVLSEQASVTGDAIKAKPGYLQGVTITGGGQGVDTVATLICDATVTVDTSSSTRKITITYSGSTGCNNLRIRTGAIVISWPAGQKWTTAGAQVTVDFKALKITRLIDNKSIVFNGTHLYTNVTGGSLVDLPNNPGTIINHTVTSSNMSITFDNGATRTWSVARQHAYSYAAGGYVVSVTGTHSDNSVEGISEWGTNRFGNSFVTEIAAPLVVESTCGWQLTSGKVSVIRPDVTTSVTFGLNAQGTATSCPIIGGTYYFEATWTGAGGKSFSVILPY